MKSRHEEDQLDRDIYGLLSEAENEAAPPDEDFLARLPQQTLETFMSASASQPIPSRRYRIMHSRTLKWVFPAAAAAMVLVVVGLWPGNGHNGTGGSGRVYGMTDIPAILAQTPIIHMTGWMYVPAFVQPGEEQTKIETEYWSDSQNGRRRFTYPGHSKENGKIIITHTERVVNGEYVMDLNLTEKTAQFTRLTPYQCILESYRDHEKHFKRILGDPHQLNTYKRVGQEEIGGRTFEIWERETVSAVRKILMRYKYKCWLEPTTGDLGRIYLWSKSEETGEDWNPIMGIETVERLTSAPADIFAIDPPAEYALINEKAYAPYRELNFEGGVGLHKVKYDAFISFVLEDDSLILGWSSIDMEASESQIDLFKDLEWGGPVPKLPIEIYGLEQPLESNKITYTGRHLAYTRKGDRFIEWSIYVPDTPPPADKLKPICQVLYRVNAPKDRISGRMVSHVSQPFNVDVYNFDAFVRGAMAELSDDGVAPEVVTYENVLQLSQQIRESAQE